MQSQCSFYTDTDRTLNLLTDCDYLCHVIYALHLGRSNQDTSPVPPCFRRHVTDTSCPFGHVAKLECEVSGVPDPEVVWYKDEEQVIEERAGKYDIIRVGRHVTLVVYDVAPADIDSYKCRIWNSVGESLSTGRIFFVPNKDKNNHGGSDNFPGLASRSLFTRPRFEATALMEKPLVMLEANGSSLTDLANDVTPDEFPVGEYPPTNTEPTSERSGGKSSVPREMEKLPTFPLPLSTGEREKPAKLAAFFPLDSNEETERFLSTGSFGVAMSPLSPMSNPESVFEPDEESDSSSNPSLDDALCKRVSWLERGETSDSDFRRGSIPYPQSLRPRRSASETDYFSSRVSFDDASRLFSTRSCGGSQHSSVDNTEASGDKTHKLKGLLINPPSPKRRSLSSSSQSSCGVGSGAIGRVVRAMSQNEYFDSFFDRGNDEAGRVDDNSKDEVCSISTFLPIQPTLREADHEDDESTVANSWRGSDTTRTAANRSPDGATVHESEVFTETEVLTNFDKVCETFTQESPADGASDRSSHIEIADHEKRAIRDLRESRHEGPRSSIIKRDSSACEEHRHDSNREMIRDASHSSRPPPALQPSTLRTLCQEVLHRYAVSHGTTACHAEAKTLNELIRTLLDISDVTCDPSSDISTKDNAKSSCEVTVDSESLASDFSHSSCSDKPLPPNDKTKQTEISSSTDSSITVDAFPLAGSQGPPHLLQHRVVEPRSDAKLEDDYEVKEVLGSGRFGKVWLVEERKSGQKFAAKLCPCRRPSQRKEFDSEIEIMNDLDHHKLLQLYDVYFGKSDVTFILELITGGELFDRLADESFELTEQLVAKYIMQISEAIKYMHSINILHLDLKPENIMCLSPERLDIIKIIDFGFARRYVPHKPLKIMFGTPEFVAPEVVNFDPLGKGTDLWSIGVITYVLLSGLSPFMGDDEQETLSNVTSGEFDFDDESFDDISDEAKHFITALLKLREKARPSCEESLKHVWLTKAAAEGAAPRKSLVVAMGNLKKFVARRKWIRSINAVRAVTKLQACLKKSDAGSTSNGRPAATSSVTSKMAELAT